MYQSDDTEEKRGGLSLANMRLDKFLSSTGLVSRKEAALLVKKGAVTVDGVSVGKADLHVDPETQRIALNGEQIGYRDHVYLMMNKPEGYVSATDDPGPYVVSLLPPQLQKIGVFPCGRLDKNTVGFLLLTDDGVLSHRLLSPARHVDKEYLVNVKFPLSEIDRTALENGVLLETGIRTLPCMVRLTGEKEALITIREGKYHQIKLMMKAVHNQVVRLERTAFAGLRLDPGMERGQYRELTADEIAHLKQCAEAGDQNRISANSTDGEE